MSGIATAIIVESSPSIKKAQPMTRGITILNRGSFAVPEEKLVSVTGAAAPPSAWRSRSRDGGARRGASCWSWLTPGWACDHSRWRTCGGATKVDSREIGPELLERWALGYLGRYASSAENLRRVLMRRVRRRSPESAQPAAALIDVLVARYRESGLLDDEAYAAGRVQSLHRRGKSIQAIRARLAAKGLAAAVVKDA